jgi:hypothetical protein
MGQRSLTAVINITGGQGGLGVLRKINFTGRVHSAWHFSNTRALNQDEIGKSFAGVMLSDDETIPRKKYLAL